MKIKYRSDVLNIEKEIIKNRRDFHKHPELSFQEYRTSKIVAKLLKKYGLEVYEKVGKTGVVGLLKGAKKGTPFAFVVASKAALNMLIRTLAVELSRTNPSALCVSLHPGTVDTSLSLPFQRGVSKEQLFNKNLAASQLLNVIDTLTINSSGKEGHGKRPKPHLQLHSNHRFLSETLVA